jgi:Mg2+ and Co2+ transporter CorA
LRQASSVQPQLGSDPIRALHPLISSLYTQFSALALKLNERLDALEQRVLHEANDQELAEITAIEERCAALLVLHAALASKHLGVVSRRLAAVATIFLPVSFLAGFWGQNFDALTGSIEKGWPAFLVLGVGLSVACVAVTVFILSRRGWN